MKKLLQNKRYTSLLLKGVALFVIIAMLFMPFASGIKKEVSGPTTSIINTYGPAFNFIFGGTLISEHTTYINESISIICLIGYVMMLLATLLIAISFILQIIKKDNNDKSINILSLIGFVSLLTGSILFLCSQPNIALLLSDAIMSTHSDSVTDTIQRNSTLMFGFMGPAIFGIVDSAIILLDLINNSFFTILFKK